MTKPNRVRNILYIAAMLGILSILPHFATAADSVTNVETIANDMATQNENAKISVDDVAVPSNFFSGPMEGDLALEMFRQLLGDGVYKATKFNTNDLSSKATSTNVTLITFMLAIMSVIGMILGMILTGYWFLMGLLQQNIDGEFLGKKWDNYMVPLRTTVAFVGMQPYPGLGGLNFVQVFVLFVILLGVGMGSSVLSYGAKFTYSTPQVSSIRPDYTGFVKNMLNSKICHEFNLDKGQYKAAGTDFRTTIQTVISSQFSTTVGTQQYRRILIGENGICGDFRYLIADNTLGLFDDVVDDERSKLLIAINKDIYIPIEQLWRDLDGAVTQNNINLVNVRNLNDLESSDINARIGVLNSALANFESSVNSIVSSAISAQLNTDRQKQYMDAVEQLGFAYAGSLHFPLLARANVIDSTLASFLVGPSIDAEKIFDKFFSFNSYLEDFQKLKLQSDSLVKMWLTNKTSFSHIGATEIIASIQMGESVENNISGMNNMVARWMIEMVRDVKGQPDPMMEVGRIGHKLELMGGILLIVQSTVQGTVDAGKSIPLLSAASGFFAPILGYIGTAVGLLFGLGIYYAEILPSMPYIMWQIAIMGYFIYCLCMLYASPLWFSMFAHPDGDAALGKASSGIPMLVTVLLKPSLMVMGLFTGMALLKVMGWFIDLTFWPTITAIHSGGGFVIFKFIGKLVIYGLVMGIAIYKANTLTWELPSLVNSMMGLGNTHQDLGENEAHQKTLVVGGIISSNSSSLLAVKGKGAVPQKVAPDPDNKTKKDGE